MEEGSYEGTENLKKHKSTLLIFCVCINASLSAFYAGYSLVYISTFENFETIINIYDIRIGTQDVTESIITGCVPVGAMIGALISSILLKKLSRRNCFLLTNFLALISLIVCFIKAAPTIILGRLIMGICTGVFSALVPLYINEFVPLQLKNFGTFNLVFIASSQSFAFLLYYLLTEVFEVSDEESYNWISNFLIVTILIQSIIFIFVFPYETPKYLLTIRKPHKCKELLEKIYYEEWAEEAYNELVSTKSEFIAAEQEIESSQELQPLKINEETEMPKVAIFLAIHVALFQQLIGIKSVVLYGGKIVNEVFPDLKKIIPVFTTLIPAITAAFTTNLMKKVGRKTLLQFGGIMLSFSLAMMCIGFGLKPNTESEGPNILIIFSLFVYMASFGLTLGPIVWLIIPEFVEPHIIPYSTMANLTGTSICVIIFPIASAQLPNKAYLFGIYLIWGVLSVIINQKFLVETKGKTREQIYKELQKIEDKFHSV